MAILAIEGFEAFGVTAGNAPVGLSTKYGAATDIDSGFIVRTGRLQGFAIEFVAATFIMFDIRAVNPSTIIIGFGFYQDAFGVANDIIQLWDGNTKQGTLQIRTDGTFKYYKGASTTTALGTTSSGISAATWTYVELKVKIHASAGTVDVLFDGTNVLTLSSQNTDASGNARVGQVLFSGSGNGADNTRLDDLYIMDTTGSVNTTYLGKQTVVVLMTPTADAGTNQFTTSSGSDHRALVDENPHTSDTDYLESSTSAQKELFTFPAVSGIANVSAVQLNTVCRLTDAQDFTMKNEIVSGATTSDDTAQAIPGPDYVTLSRLVEADPNTSAAWTVANVNAAQFGFKLG